MMINLEVSVPVWACRKPNQINKPNKLFQFEDWDCCIPCWDQWFWKKNTRSVTNIAPENRPSLKRKRLFQTCISRCELFVLREGIVHQVWQVNLSNIPLASCFLTGHSIYPHGPRNTYPRIFTSYMHLYMLSNSPALSICMQMHAFICLNMPKPYFKQHNICVAWTTDHMTA